MARLRIDELLEERGITAYRLAVDTGLTHSSLSKMRKEQTREIRLDAIDRLCSVLQCSVQDLIEVEPIESGGASSNGQAATKSGAKKAARKAKSN